MKTAAPELKVKAALLPGINVTNHDRQTTAELSYGNIPKLR